MSEQFGMPGGASTRQGPRASFGIRLVAALIDGAILFVVGWILGRAGTVGSALSILAGFAYAVYLEGSASGQTVGKKVMNIRVVHADTGASIGYGGAAIRYVGKIISAIPCLLGYFWMLWDKDKQTWHDKIATSVVVPTSDYPVEAWPG